MKPMLAGTIKDISQIKYPVLCTPKIDGIRCLTVDGKAVSRSLKPIRNKYICEELAELPDGLDGELVLRSKSTFGEVSSAVMSTDGRPDFVYMVFDYWKSDQPYDIRMDKLGAIWVALKATGLDRLYPLIPEVIEDEEELLKYEEECLAKGFEGVMVRSEDGPYKFGRSTVREGYLLKLKRFVDSEAEIRGFVEQISNDNPVFRNELGRSARSARLEGLRPKGTLGALLVTDLKTRVEFKIGTGFDDKLRQAIWQDMDSYKDKLVKYKSQPVGEKDKPRFPVFLSFRDRDDL